MRTGPVDSRADWWRWEAEPSGHDWWVGLRVVDLLLGGCGVEKGIPRASGGLDLLGAHTSQADGAVGRVEAWQGLSMIGLERGQ